MINKEKEITGLGSVLIIVIGGNISQKLVTPDSQSDSELKIVEEEDFNEFIFKKKSKGTQSIILREANVIKMISVDVRRPFRKENYNLDLEGQDSSQINPKMWAQLASYIDGKKDEYEGFVILHGLDTLSYTASAISFMVKDFGKPIVFTGSQRPLDFPRSDARQNICTSLTIAASKSLNISPVIPEVTIYLHDTLYRGNRANMSSASSYRSFDSLNYPALATVGERIDIKEKLVREHSQSTTPYLKSDKKVQILDVFPGMSLRFIEGIIPVDFAKMFANDLKQNIEIEIENTGGQALRKDSEEFKIIDEIEKVFRIQTQTEKIVNLLEENNKKKAQEVIEHLEKGKKNEDYQIRGVILRTYGMGTLPTGILKALRKLVDNGIIVMNVTQAHSSHVSFNSDLLGLRLFEHGVISGLDMISEAAFAKMVVILSNNEIDYTQSEERLDDIEDQLQKNITGEQSYTVYNHHFIKGETLYHKDLRKFQHNSFLKFRNKKRLLVIKILR